MARPKSSATKPSNTTSITATIHEYKKSFRQLASKYLTITYGSKLLFDPSQLGIVSWIILVAELVLNVLVVQRVRYTEIDWIAYMQECEGFLNGTTNYAMLKGKYICVDRLEVKNRFELPKAFQV